MQYIQMQRATPGSQRSATPNQYRYQSQPGPGVYMSQNNAYYGGGGGGGDARAVMSQEDVHKMASVYAARRQRVESEQQIAQLLNRINLLKKEDERNAKKINDAVRKTDEVQDRKRQRDEEMRRKLRQQIHEEEFLKFMQHKQVELRKQQRNERVAIRNALVELKQEERDEVKRMSRVNSEKIRDLKSRDLDVKLKRHDHLINKKQVWKEKVSHFWEERIVKQQEHNQVAQSEELKAKLRNDKLVEALEREEMELIRRLQRSQTLAESALARLDDAQRLGHREFEDKYGRAIAYNNNNTTINNHQNTTVISNINNPNQTLNNNNSALLQNVSQTTFGTSRDYAHH